MDNRTLLAYFLDWTYFALTPNLAGLKPVFSSFITAPDLKVGVTL